MSLIFIYCKISVNSSLNSVNGVYLVGRFIFPLGIMVYFYTITLFFLKNTRRLLSVASCCENGVSVRGKVI